MLLVGASAGKLLPRAGAWMDTVKNLFGVLFLAVAAWMLSRIVPGWASLLLWRCPAFALAWVLWRAVRETDAGRGNAARGRPCRGLVWRGVAGRRGARRHRSAGADSAAGRRQQTPLEFKRIKTVADLEREVAAATAAGKTVMLDFYADWCVSCKEMEHYTFTEPEVQAALGEHRAAAGGRHANDEQDQALLQHFGIFGPPDHRLLWRRRRGTAKLPRRRIHEGCGVRGRGPASDRAPATLHTHT